MNDHGFSGSAATGTTMTGTPRVGQRMARATEQQLTQRVQSARSDDDHLSAHLGCHVSENNRR
jgi:hypothetical protein